MFTYFLVFFFRECEFKSNVTDLLSLFSLTFFSLKWNKIAECDQNRIDAMKWNIYTKCQKWNVRFESFQCRRDINVSILADDGSSSRFGVRWKLLNEMKFSTPIDEWREWFENLWWHFWEIECHLCILWC